jgi:anaerobic selenocysteine-containing dehydrogenase
LNPLHICEADAAARGLHNGDAIRVFNQYGSIETQVYINNDLRSGSVAMTHGYGHAHAYGLQLASRTPGANCNALMPTDASSVEPLSYMSWVSGVPVQVEKEQT